MYWTAPSSPFIRYTSAGRLQEARTVLLEGVDVDSRLAIPYALSSIPIIPVSEAEIEECRTEAWAMIDAVIKELQSGGLVMAPAPGSNALMIDTGYSLTYHGHNNEPFRRRIGLMHGLGYPFLVSVSSRLGLPTNPAALVAAERNKVIAEAERGYRGAARVPPALSAK
jgi:hypothetical protein